MQKLLRLKGKIQPYAWGGTEFIPALLGIEETGKPAAEYWMGAHPSASATINSEIAPITLHDLIKSEPETYLGKKTLETFGELPYLLKVLDVKDMLSIQVHPSRPEAIKGYEAEEAAGILINAANRNYKDKNHKPEIMVALSEFWLLHGFKVEQLLKETLTTENELNFLLPVFENEGYFGLYKTVMEFSQEKINQILAPLVKRALATMPLKNEPAYWVKKLYPDGHPVDDIDRGVFSIYFFNIVRVEPGEAVFQGAGVPHAYLEGQNVELMANSDNVLRGGLTPKHVDVPELLKHTSFEGIIPNILKGDTISQVEKNYPCPVDDFAISAITLNNTYTYQHTSASPEIYLVTEGEVKTSDNQTFTTGEVFFTVPGYTFSLTAQNKTLVYKAFLNN